MNDTIPIAPKGQEGIEEPEQQVTDRVQLSCNTCNSKLMTFLYFETMPQAITCQCQNCGCIQSWEIYTKEKAQPKPVGYAG